MGASWLGDLKNSAIVEYSLAPQQVLVATAQGSAVDMLNAEGPISLIVQVGAVSGTYTTLQVKVQQSTATATASFADLSPAVQTDTVLASGTTTVLTFWKERTQRYVRAFITPTGGTNAQIATTFLARKKISGSGDGSQVT